MSLEWFREHTRGWAATIIIAFLILGFGLWGIQYYLQGGGKRDVVAKFNGEKISRRTLNQAYDRVRQRELIRGHSASLPPTMQKALKKALLEQLVRTQILVHAAVSDGFMVTPEQLDLAVVGMPMFRVHGRFSPQRFTEVLSRLLYTPQTFLDELKKSMLVSQMRSGIVDTSFILGGEIENALTLINQTRDFSYAVLSAKTFEQKAVTSEKMIKAYYSNHQDDFKTKEKVQLEYIVLENKSNIKHFSEQYDKLSELTYTNPSSLMPAADALQVKIHSTPFITSEGQATGFLKDPKVLKAAFSESVLQQGNNSAAIQLEGNKVIVLRVKDRQHAKVRPLKDVKAKIIARLKQAAGKENVKSVGEAVLAKLKAKQSVPSSLKWHDVKHAKRNQSTIDPFILVAAFRYPLVKASPRFASATLDNGDYVLIKVTKVYPGSRSIASAQKRNVLNTLLESNYGRYDYDLYVSNVLKHTKIKYY